MSQKAHIHTILARASQPHKGAGILALAAPELEPHNSPSTPSPVGRFLAWQGTEDDGERTARFSHSLLLQPGCWPRTMSSSTTVRLHQHPERHRVLQAGVSVMRQFSCIFPAHPRSLASVLLPRPAARRCSASHFVRPAGLGFQRKNLAAALAQSTGEIFCSEPPQKAHLGTWERGTSRRFAQECPEGNPGKYKQGETPWHSTKTKSL
jgi:hypothetical protein